MSIGHNLPTAWYLTGVNGAKQKKKEISEFWLQMKWSGVNSLILQQQRLCLYSAWSKELSTLSTKKCFSHCTLHTLDLILSTVFRFGHRISRKILMYLKTVQRRASATKLVRCTKNLSYEQRLEYLGLYSLSRRKQRGDLIET